MKTRILIYGGTQLTPDLVQFVGRLTRMLLIKFPDVVLLSGGFKRYKRHPDRTSVDKAVVTEAEKILDPERFVERFETWLASEDLDRRTVDRFTDKGTIHKVSGTAQARRFAMVKAADAIVTITGEGQTQTVLEFALALGKPALPVAFSGGDSRRLWFRHRDDFLRLLVLKPELVRRLEQESPPAKQLGQLASKVAAAVHDAAKKRCLVLMPFGRGHDRFYLDVLHPSIERLGYIPHRIDRDEHSGHIESLFDSAVERARAVVIDVTGANPNVMYELGQVHARRVGPPLLIIRQRLTKKAYSGLAFYLQHERLVAAPDNKPGHRNLITELKRYLDFVGTQQMDADR